jgi:acyl carrier protein
MATYYKISTLEIVLESFTEISGKEITKDQKINKLEMDSLDMLEITMEIEKRLGIIFSEDYQEKFLYNQEINVLDSTIEQFSEKLEAYLKESPDYKVNP